MRTGHGRALAGLAFLGCVLSSCSGAGPSPADLALQRAEGRAEAHATDESFTLRLNKATCDCPEFEVLLDGTWTRVFLEPKDPEGPAEATRQALTAGPESGPNPTVRVAGRLSKSIRLSGNKLPCLVLKVFQLCGPDGCRPAE